jgi:SPP1 family predicted phage head-tail adaptor
MRSGRLQYRITLQRLTAAEDSFGAHIETWSDIATVWAEKIEVRGTESFVAQQLVAGIDTKFRIRYRKNLTPLNRLICDGRYYLINALLEIGYREGWEIYATARTEESNN